MRRDDTSNSGSCRSQGMGALAGSLAQETVQHRNGPDLLCNAKVSVAQRPPRGRRCNRIYLDIIGAGGGNRTRTARRPRDFKSRASASSATPACVWILAVATPPRAPALARGPMPLQPQARLVGVTPVVRALEYADIIPTSECPGASRSITVRGTPSFNGSVVPAERTRSTSPARDGRLATTSVGSGTWRPAPDEQHTQGEYCPPDTELTRSSMHQRVRSGWRTMSAGRRRSIRAMSGAARSSKCRWS